MFTLFTLIKFSSALYYLLFGGGLNELPAPEMHCVIGQGD